MKRRKSKNIIIASILLTAILLLLALVSSGLAETGSEREKVSALLKDLFGDEIDKFVYIREGRPDPFMPYKEKEAPVVAVDKKEEVVEEELTGMRQFEPGQLTLVAIVLGTNEPLAMVQDSTNKGYAIRRGTRIGRFGVVEDIIPNQVIIKNATITMAGDKRYSKVKMVLKKEGDE